MINADAFAHLAAAILKLPSRTLVFGKTECQNSPEFCFGPSKLLLLPIRTNESGDLNALIQIIRKHNHAIFHHYVCTHLFGVWTDSNANTGNYGDAYSGDPRNSESHAGADTRASANAARSIPATAVHS